MVRRHLLYPLVFFCLLLLFCVFFFPTGSLCTISRKIMKFGTFIHMTMSSICTNYGPTMTNSVAPPLVQKSTIGTVIIVEHFVTEKRNVVDQIILLTLNTVRVLREDSAILRCTALSFCAAPPSNSYQNRFR